jgi:cephalosporin hydroxylase
MQSRSSLPLIGAIALILILGASNLYQYRAASGGSQEPLPASARQVVDAFPQLFYASRGTWSRNTWLGISTQQNPNDAWVTQEILYEVKPDVVFEAGTAAGGSAILWATILEQFNPDARVVTVDIVNSSREARKLPIAKRRVDFLVGSSTEPRIVAEVRRLVGGKRALVILDSDHAQHHVARELDLYADLVSVGSYLIVQDTNVNGHPVFPEHGPGPWEAVEAFLERNPQFEVDRSRERLLFTMHPRGYLKRVR